MGRPPSGRPSLRSGTDDDVPLRAAVALAWISRFTNPSQALICFYCTQATMNCLFQCQNVMYDEAASILVRLRWHLQRLPLAGCERCYLGCLPRCCPLARCHHRCRPPPTHTACCLSSTLHLLGDRTGTVITMAIETYCPGPYNNHTGTQHNSAQSAPVDDVEFEGRARRLEAIRHRAPVSQPLGYAARAAATQDFSILGCGAGGRLEPAQHLWHLNARTTTSTSEHQALRP